MATLASAVSIVSEVSFLFHIIPPEDRTGAIAIKTIICGSLSFLSTLITKPIFESVQAKEMILFDTRIYAQQILSFISVVIATLLLIYFYFFCYKPIKIADKQKEESDNSSEEKTDDSTSEKV